MSAVCVCQHGADDHEPACVIVDCDCQMFRVEESLDAAWQEAEAALPDDLRYRGIAVAPRAHWTEPDATGYWAGVPAPHSYVRGDGPTPAAALRALAVKLREGRE